MKGLSEEVIKLIQEAIQLEIDGRAFFDHAAQITHNELGKKMFLRLAQEEVKHLEAFSKLFSSIVKTDKWKKYVKREESKPRSQVIEELASRMKKAEGKSEIEALSIGMELEQRAIRFFSSTAQDMSDYRAKEIFERICDEERFHYDLLQAQYDSLTHSGFWLDSAEFQMDGKY